MLSRNLEQTLHRAISVASECGHEFATLEHLLLALLKDDDAATILKACGVDIGILDASIREFLDAELQTLKTSNHSDPKPSLGFQRVLQRAAIHVQSSGRE